MCVCVYLEISLKTRSFKNCSTHNSHLFHPHSVWFLLQHTKCSTKFCFPNKLLREISLSQTKFWAKFRCPYWNKMPCEISQICTKFQWYGNNRCIEISTKMRFLQNIAQLRQISLKFALIPFAQYCKTACACTVSTLCYWHGTHFVIYTVSQSGCSWHDKHVVGTVSALIFTRTKAIVSIVFQSNTKEIFNEQNPHTVASWLSYRVNVSCGCHHQSG